MSIISVHIHFHDGELTKLAAYFVDGYVAAARCVLQKASGNYEASQRRYHEAIKNMALMKKYLTPEQKETILHALRLVMQKQAALNDEDAALSKKERLLKYKKAVKDFDKVIKMTSDIVSADLGLNGGDAEAYRMALACTSADVDAKMMMHEVMSMFENVDAPGGTANPPMAPQPLTKGNPAKESKPSKESKRSKPPQQPKPSKVKQRSGKGKKQAAVDVVPKVLMASMADRLKDVTLA